MKIRVIRYSFAALFIIFQNGIFAQSADMQRVVGPSPNVAALFKFVDQPVSLYSGTSQIEIPIYTLKVGKIELPISLSYHSSGIKVTEVASWAGLGWALNAGGAVTVSTYGLPDLTYLNSRITKSVLDKCEVTSILNGVSESQPDLYFFNFLNQSGEFYFNDSLRITQIPYTNIKIDTTTSPVGSTAWKITNTDGTIYIFDLRELNPTTEQIVNGTSGGNVIVPGAGRSGHPNVSSPTWFLTKIISPTGDSVILNYQSYTAAIEYFRGETNYTQQSGLQLTCPGGPAVNPPANTSNYELQQINGYRLQSIVSRNGTVQFKTGSNRCDLLGDNFLSEIDVSDNTGKLIKKVSMVYNYLSGNTLYATSQVNCSTEAEPSIGYVDVTMPSLQRRLMLMEVDEINTISGQVDNSYKMNYQISSGLPSRFSPQQDTWGYYNGNGQTSLLQNLTPSGQFSGGISVPTINGRDPNISYSEIGTLQKITYPTGGSASFTYESNSYRQEMLPNHELPAGGLRIKQVVYFDSVNNLTVTKNYDYSLFSNNILASSGVLPGPSLAALTNVYLTARDLSCTNPDLPDAVESPIVPMLIVNSNTNYPLTYTHGSTVGYGQVTETSVDQNGNDIGRTVYTFSTPQDDAYQLMNIVPNDFNTYPQSSNDLYPFAPTFSNEWERGLLLNKEDYKNTGNNTYFLVKSEQNFYSLPKVLDTTHGLTVGYYLNSQMPNSAQCTPPLGVGYNIYSIFKYCNYQIYSKYVTLDSTTTETFDNNSNFVKTATYYAYNNGNLLPGIIKTLDSKNEFIISNKKYPTDYALSGTPSNAISLAIKNLQNENIVVPVIENYIQKSNTDGSNLRTISATLSTFRTDKPLPDTVYQLETTTPITGFSPALITNTSFSKSSYYVPRIEFDKYDVLGNISQQRKYNDVIHAYLWDYQNCYPVAEVVNTDSTSIAYTSFEADGSGNWTIPSTTRDSIDAAITGSKSYILSNGAISKSGLTSTTTYIVSYWSRAGSSYTVTGSTSVKQGKTINGWTYFEHTVTGVTTVSISGSSNIDELRLYPFTAQMTTYTYSPLIGITSQCDAENRITYYFYDGLQRLKWIKDQDGNIIKTIQYHYKGQ